MRKKIIIVIFILLSFLTITACKRKETDKLVVYASVYPVYDFAKKIAGDKAYVHLIVPHGVEPHNYEPDASIAVKLTEADLFIYNGAGMEFWVDKTLEVLDDSTHIVRAVDGIQLIDRISHKHNGEDEDDDDLTKVKDPHVWLDPNNAIKQMENITQALTKIDPKNKDYYQENFEYNKFRLTNLHYAYISQLQQFTKRKFIVSHEAFAYLAQAYNLEQKSIQGISPEGEPDFSQITAAIKYAKEHNIHVIFHEPTDEGKSAKTIAREIGGTTDILHPFEGISKKEEDRGVDYFEVMERNLMALIKAFAKMNEAKNGV